MSKFLELAITNGGALLTGFAAVMLALAQLIKAWKKPRPQDPPSTTDVIHAAMQPESWSKSLFREVRGELFSAAMTLVCLLAIAVLDAPVKAYTIVGVAVFTGNFYLTIWIMAEKAKRLARRLAYEEAQQSARPVK